MPFTQNELIKIREELPWGSAKAIAKKLNLNHGHVRNVLSGTANNDDVILAAIEISRQHKEKIDKAKSDLKTLA